ncbi:MAG: MFS transporter [Chloroflexi bacterium]|nr:MFS transporter [Chloroflexota bacterium]
MTTSPAGRAESVLRNADFNRLWTAETISQFGTQVSLLAIPLVAVTLLHATPFEVALLGTIEFLPFILFSLPAGAWVDRLRRRPILIAGDLGRAVMLASVPIAYALDVLTMAQLYIVGFVVGTLTVFFDVAYQSYLPSLVERDQLVDGNGKLEASRTVAQSAGPALGGGLIGLVTAPLAILADSLSFLLSGLFVFLIRRTEPAPDRHADEHGRPRGSLRQEVSEGLRYVLGNRYLGGIAASTATSNFFSNVAFATFIVYAIRVLGLSPLEIGLTFGLGNVGGVIGALTASRIAGRFGVGPTIIGAMVLAGPGLLLIALAPREFPIPFLVAGSFLQGVAVVVYNINQLSFRQAVTPTAMQGRMNATIRFIVWGAIPLGSIVGGIIATAVGLQAAILVGAVGAFLAVIPLVITPVRTLRDMPTPAEDT